MRLSGRRPLRRVLAVRAAAGIAFGMLAGSVAGPLGMLTAAVLGVTLACHPKSPLLRSN